jgi:hypothetical protein
MQARQVRSSGWRLRIGALAATAVVPAVALTGCGGASHSTASPLACGKSRTAANTPIEVEVISGKVACSVALHVESAYAEAIRSGKAAGNGGGAPVTVSGWTCQGFATPEVDKTGDTSKCVRDGVELLTVINLPAS